MFQRFDMGCVNVIRIGICDDLKFCREELRGLCISWAEKQNLAVDIVCSRDTGEIVHLCTTSKGNFDIVFMDIEFGENFNGVDAVKEINRLCPYCKIIYVTAYSEYAPEVYETEHAYFVLKNNNMSSNVCRALDKALDDIRRDKDEIISIRAGGVCLIPVKDIICFERDGRVTIIKTIKEDFRTYETFDEILDKIGSRRVKRCHKSYAVNFFHVIKYTKAKFIMDNEQTVPISRAYQKEIFECFTDYMDGVVVEPVL